jgi:hypothetical protein
MKRLHSKATLRGLLTAGALGALALIGSSTGGDLGGAPSASAGLAIADEAIGSLPTYWAPPGPVILPGLDGTLLALEQLKPSIQIRMPYDAFSGAFVDGKGVGYALLSDLEDGNLLVRLFGDVTVVVQRNTLQMPEVVSVLRQGLLYEQGVGKIFLAGFKAPAFDLSATGGAVGLPYSDPYYANLFQNGGVAVSLVNDAGHVGLLRSSPIGDLISLSQVSD